MYQEDKPLHYYIFFMSYAHLLFVLMCKAFEIFTMSFVILVSEDIKY
jgi:hypothetical protein